MSMKKLAFVVSLALVTGCAEPASAPSEYEALLGYLFEHMEDEDDAELVVGLENLFVWLQEPENFGAASSG